LTQIGNISRDPSPVSRVLGGSRLKDKHRAAGSSGKQSIQNGIRALKQAKSKSSRRDKNAHMTLASVLDAAHGDELRASLNELIENPQPVTLDAGEVERVDTAGLQVLAAFVTTRRSQGRAIEWQKISPELRRATELLGLSALMELTA
jgi:anti-anti-sigma regulatory factor